MKNNTLKVSIKTIKYNGQEDLLYKLNQVKKEGYVTLGNPIKCTDSDAIVVYKYSY